MPVENARKFDFQEDWFELIRAEWETKTAPLQGLRLRVLELGSFEGRSTTWILNNLMDHPSSRMTAVDTFAGGMEHREPDSDGAGNGRYALPSLEERFRRNVSRCEHAANKLRVLKMSSDDALLQLRQEGCRFDFIYIDASHVAIDVLHDAVLSWRMLEEGGSLVFDDYSWQGYLEDCYNPRIAIDSFISCAAPEAETEETESQLWVRKVKNHIPATPNPDPALYYWDKGLAKKSH